MLQIIRQNMKESLTSLKRNACWVNVFETTAKVIATACLVFKISEQFCSQTRENKLCSSITVWRFVKQQNCNVYDAHLSTS